MGTLRARTHPDLRDALVILYIVASLVLLLGLGLIAIAYLSAHRTIIPAIRQAVYLWWPGLGLVTLSMLIALGPRVFTYSQCQSACDVNTPSLDAAFAKNVPQDFDNCVKSGVGEIKRNVFERMKDGATGLDPEKAAADAEPGIRDVCEGMVQSQCISVCYNPQAGEGDKAAVATTP